MLIRYFKEKYMKNPKWYVSITGEMSHGDFDKKYIVNAKTYAEAYSKALKQFRILERKYKGTDIKPTNIEVF